MRHLQERPFGPARDQGKEEPALIGRQTVLELPYHSVARGQKGLDLDGLGSHADETALEFLSDVAHGRKQDLVDRPVVAREIDDESATDAGRDAFVRE